MAADDEGQPGEALDGALASFPCARMPLKRAWPALSLAFLLAVAVYDVITERKIKTVTAIALGVILVSIVSERAWRRRCWNCSSSALPRWLVNDPG